ncbi:ABC transporter permease [Nocardioides sp. JQ2195]|uniref:ABC transporter permease subunit n=1 Tax=Nocardioides sp. JQ2195 TaxID=2592334 RepID=UPI00143ECD71|nr:ABC transporter permease subunit [Nocardioides sp. JQ2195]QIX28038.1 ABC transporter permease [Nocardioides sp. JQ2195]
MSAPTNPATSSHPTRSINGLVTSTRAELLRLRRWPAVWVTVGAWLALSLMFGYVFNYVSYTSGSNDFSNEGTTKAMLLAQMMPSNVPDVLVQGMPMFGGTLLMVLGAIVAGNGYGWGTWKTIFTQGPSRLSVVGGSMAALTVFVVGILVLSLLFDLACSLAIAGIESQAVTWPAFGDVATSVGAGFLVLEMWALAGYLLGTVARGPALSVGLGLVWALVVENLLRGVGQLLDPVEAFTHVLPGTAAGSLVGAIMGTSDDGTPGVLDVISGTRATWTVAAYVVVLPLLAGWLVRRRDVS